MLKLTPASRRRLAAGAASVSMLAAAGLALTASGTGAAAAVRAVQEAVPPAPAAPPAPPAPAAAPRVPAAPAAPVVVPVRAGSRRGQTVTVVTTRDGQTSTRTYSTADGPLPPEAARALANAPLVRDGTCPGEDGPTTEQRREGTRPVILICRNRIGATVRRSQEAMRAGQEAARRGQEAARRGEEAARRGEEEARRAAVAVAMLTPLPPMPPAAALRATLIERDALRSALSGLKLARRNVERAEMPEEARREALAGIDQGLREVEENIRRAD